MDNFESSWRATKLDGMNIAFLLPSLLYGVFLFTSTGSFVLLILSGSTVLVWLFVKGTQQDLKQAVSFAGGRVFLGRRRLPASPLLWGAKLRSRVYEAAFAQDVVAKSKTMPPGKHVMTHSGEFLSLMPGEHAPHLIAIGPTGSGKTELIRKVLADFAGAVFVIDFKNGEGFGDSVSSERKITNSSSDEEISSFFDLLENKSSLRLPLLLVIDELGEAMRNTKIATEIERYAAQGRSRRTYLLMANQTLSMVPRTIWVNCSIRVALAADQVDVAQLQIAAKSPAETNAMRQALVRIGQDSFATLVPDFSALSGEPGNQSGDNGAPSSNTLDLVRDVSSDEGGSSSDKSKWLRLPFWRAMLNPTKLGERGLSPQNQISQGPPGEVTGANTIPDISTRMSNLGHRV